MSVVFDFSASLNDVTPVSPMPLSAYVKRNEKSDLLMGAFCVFLLSLPVRKSVVSVVFDFNVSLNDVAPVSPMLLSVDEKRNEKSELLMDVFVSLLSFVFTFQTKVNECCV